MQLGIENDLEYCALSPNLEPSPAVARPHAAPVAVWHTQFCNMTNERPLVHLHGLRQWPTRKGTSIARRAKNRWISTNLSPLCQPPPSIAHEHFTAPPITRQRIRLPNQNGFEDSVKQVSPSPRMPMKRIIRTLSRSPQAAMARIFSKSGSSRCRFAILIYPRQSDASSSH